MKNFKFDWKMFWIVFGSIMYGLVFGFWYGCLFKDAQQIELISKKIKEENENLGKKVVKIRKDGFFLDEDDFD